MLNFNQSLLITSSVIGIKKPEINNRSKPVYDIFLLLLTLLIKPKSSSSIKITLLKNISKIFTQNKIKNNFILLLIIISSIFFFLNRNFNKSIM